MDSPEDEELPCVPIHPDESTSCTVVDAEVQLDLSHDIKTESDEFESAFENNFTNTSMKLPITLQNCVPAGIQMSSEVVVIANAGPGFMNQPKMPLSGFHAADNGEPETKRICIEQNGHTFILALQDGINGLPRVVELPQKTFAPVDTAQFISFQDTTSCTPESIQQTWFTSKEEKTNLHRKGHVWKQGMWSKEETELLEKNIKLYCEEHDVCDPATVVFEMSKDERKDFYRTVAKGLNRPLFSIYRRVIRMYDNKNHMGKYSLEELKKLKELRTVYGNDWQAIGAAMGRSASSIKDRCRLMKDNCNQGKWELAEEQRLADAVYELSNSLPGEMVSSGLSWADVACRVGTRSEKQCRTKWLNYLNWKMAGGTEWTKEDDISLICRVCATSAPDENLVDWAELAKGWLSVRSPQWLRGKWWNLKRHVPNPNEMSFQEICDYLYQHFVLKLNGKNDSSKPVVNIDLMLNHPKSAVLQSINLSNTPPPIVTATAQVCPSPIVSLPNAPCLGLVNSPATLTPMRVGPVLQTIEMLPQNIELSAPSNEIHLGNQTFVLTQAHIPLSTTVPGSPIIIQTLPHEEVHEGKDLMLQLESQDVEIIETEDRGTLTSLASTQMPSAPPSPNSINEDSLDDPNSSLLENSFVHDPIDENGNISHVCEIETEPVSIDENKSNHLISDPMLAANNPEMVMSDPETEKLNSSEN